MSLAHRSLVLTAANLAAAPYSDVLDGAGGVVYQLTALGYDDWLM